MILIMPIIVDSVSLESVRYKGGAPKIAKPLPPPKIAEPAKPPKLPPPAQTPTEIIAQASQAGASQSRRLRKRSSRAASRTTRPSLALQLSPTQQAGLKTNLG